ncbi:hypothetical protein [Archangium lipolyticum]|uniref:hypothetical protein n=1 Tax=Archangium lipolyticum TaxID=2970465 RepID=UPI00214B2EE4|nr:hypothetical protein [Archangium lipolyticum]
MTAYDHFAGDFGGHTADFSDALTLFEVGALLARGARAVGCEFFTEFPPSPTAGRRGRRIDFVWAVRAHQPENGRRWLPLAAFEVEGLDVPAGSLEQDVERLAELAHGEEIPMSVILYRTTETGWMFWNPGPAPKAREDQLLELVRSRLAARPPPCGSVEAVLDRELLQGKRLARWVDQARTRFEALRLAGRLA